MYESSKKYERTQAELTNEILSWQRSDVAFFAAGACHILAFTFAKLHQDKNYQIIYIEPEEEFWPEGTHVYVTDGIWAFDFNGWLLEEELLQVVEKTCKETYPIYSFSKTIINDDLETFCRLNRHKPPSHFLHLPWERAYGYIAKFPQTPPEEI